MKLLVCYQWTIGMQVATGHAFVEVTTLTEEELMRVADEIMQKMTLDPKLKGKKGNFIFQSVTKLDESV